MQIFRKGGMPHGDQGKKTHAHSHQRAGGQSGQAPVKHKRAEAREESAELPEVAGTGSQKGMAQACQTDGADRHPDRGDMAAFAGYCQAYARWKEAEEFITQHGSIVKTPSGYWQQVPQVSIAQTYLKIMNRFAEQFGLTPSSRSRIIAEDNSNSTVDEMEALLGGGS